MPRAYQLGSQDLGKEIGAYFYFVYGFKDGEHFADIFDPISMSQIVSSSIISWLYMTT